MLDLKKMRSDIQGMADRLKTRGYTLDVDQFTQLDQARQDHQKRAQDLQTARNKAAKQVGALKAKGESVTALLETVSDVGDDLKKAEQDLSMAQESLNDLMLTIPNLPGDTTPIGASEEENVVVRQWGDKPSFDFEPKDHVDLGEALGGIDFECGAKLSGSRFVVLQSDVARLHRALGQFMLDVQTQQHGYTEIDVPLLVGSHCLYGTGQLPKFAEDFFQMEGERDLLLIPTAEVALANLVREQILQPEELPLKVVALTACFRKEAGSYGKDTRGIIRQHQFYKVELVQVVLPEHSDEALEELTGHAEKILQLLELPYQVVSLCTGDLGFSATKTYDLEVWLPGQNRYREISSCSYCGDFQARRMQTRWRSPQMKKPEWVHTLNGSGLAVGRTLVAVLENGQQADGSIEIPAVLQPYMQGQTKIQSHLSA